MAFDHSMSAHLVKASGEPLMALSLTQSARTYETIGAMVCVGDVPMLGRFGHSKGCFRSESRSRSFIPAEHHPGTVEKGEMIRFPRRI